MKSERRHELEKNDLADRLAKGIETIKPYQNAILAAILVVVVVTGSYGWWVRRSTAQTEGAWDTFYQAMGKMSSGPAGFDDAMSEFDDIIAEHPNTHLAHWTAVVAGDLRLELGCNQLFISKPDANQQLRQAIELFDKVRTETRVATLRRRATFGLARATEAMGADLKKAAQLYGEVTEGAYAAEAGRRAEELSQGATLEFYDKFAKFDPKPAYLDEPGIPGERPSFDLDSLPGGTPSDGPSSDGPGTSEGSIFAPPLMDLKEEGAADDQPSDPTQSSSEEGQDDPSDVEPSDVEPPVSDESVLDESPPDTDAPETAEPTGDATENPEAAGDDTAEETSSADQGE